MGFLNVKLVACQVEGHDTSPKDSSREDTWP